MWGYLDPLPGREDIRGYRAFYWHKMDGWYEEEEQIFEHPQTDRLKLFLSQILRGH